MSNSTRVWRCVYTRNLYSRPRQPGRMLMAAQNAMSLTLLLLFGITSLELNHRFPISLLLCAPFRQAVAAGSPTHPSYPAGHAVQNGAFATVLKVHNRCLHLRTIIPDVHDPHRVSLLAH